MKTILSSDTMDIPDGVKIKVIEVEGRGKLSKNFKHLNLDFQLITDEETGKKKLKIDDWFGSRKTTASIRTALSHPHQQSDQRCHQGMNDAETRNIHGEAVKSWLKKLENFAFDADKTES